MSSMVLSGDTSGTVTVTVPAVSGTNTATLPAATGTVMVSGNMPTFSAYANGAVSVPTVTFTKMQCNTKEWDTNSYYDATTNYRFQPLIAGYYQIDAAITWGTIAVGGGITSIFKNGSEFKRGSLNYLASTINVTSIASAIIYFNGSSDYVELYGYQNSGSSLGTYAGSPYTYFQAAMVRAA